MASEKWPSCTGHDLHPAPSNEALQGLKQRKADVKVPDPGSWKVPNVRRQLRPRKSEGPLPGGLPELRAPAAPVPDGSCVTQVGIQPFEVAAALVLVLGSKGHLLWAQAVAAGAWPCNRGQNPWRGRGTLLQPWHGARNCWAEGSMGRAAAGVGGAAWALGMHPFPCSCTDQEEGSETHREARIKQARGKPLASICVLKVEDVELCSERAANKKA